MYSSAIRRLASSRRARPRAIALACQTEGGQFWSVTARHLLLKYGGVEIGAYSYGECFQLGAFPSGVSIGRYCSIASGVRVFVRNHPVDTLSTHPFFYNAKLGFVGSDTVSNGTLEIGADTWIGERAMITPRCTRIGVGAVIGAGSVVTKDVPDFAIVAGNPAKLLKVRFDENTQEVVLASRWWERPVASCVRELEAMCLPVPSEATNHPLLEQQKTSSK